MSRLDERLDEGKTTVDRLMPEVLSEFKKVVELLEFETKLVHKTNLKGLQNFLKELQYILRLLNGIQGGSYIIDRREHILYDLIDLKLGLVTSVVVEEETTHAIRSFTLSEVINFFDFALYY